MQQRQARQRRATAALTSHEGSLLGSALTAHLNSSRAREWLPASRSNMAQACAGGGWGWVAGSQAAGTRALLS